MEISYISTEEAIVIHEKTVYRSGGGAYEILDGGRIDSILFHIQNDDYYPTFVDKLHHMFFAFCKFHCFADGNKRIAITLCANFLLRNGYLCEAAAFLRQTENITYHVASGAVSEELLREIIVAIMGHTFEDDSQLAYRIALSIAKDEPW